MESNGKYEQEATAIKWGTKWLPSFYTHMHTEGEHYDAVAAFFLSLATSQQHGLSACHYWYIAVTNS